MIGHEHVLPIRAPNASAGHPTRSRLAGTPGSDSCTATPAWHVKAEGAGMSTSPVVLHGGVALPGVPGWHPRFRFGLGNVRLGSTFGRRRWK